MTDATDVQIAEACQLPLAERPLRLAEFEALFARGITAQQRPSPTVLRLTLRPGVEMAARDLTARETACCSFFTFGFSFAGDGVRLEVEVPPAYVRVLDALADRASIGLGAA
jgi:hypothetical protein